MRGLLVSLVVASMIGIAPLCKAQQQTSDYVNKYYALWNTPAVDGGDSRPFVGASFDRDVPDAIKGEVLGQLLDRACSSRHDRAYGVIERILNYMLNMGPLAKFPDSVDNDFYALAKDSKYATTKIYVLQELALLNRKKDYAVIISALGDSDDQVRVTAFHALISHPETESACREFVKDHQTDASYSIATSNVKDVLKKLRKPASSQ